MPITRFTSPWGRVHEGPPPHRMTPRRFSLTFGACLVLGIVVSFISAFASLYAPVPALPFVVGGVMMLSGFHLTELTDDWRGSLIGLVVFNLGMGCSVGAWSETLLSWPFQVLALLIGGLCVLSPLNTAFPHLAVWASSLPAALLGLPAGAFALSVAGGVTPTWSACVAALSVLVYVDYFWTRAMSLPRNLDYAVDAACAIYLSAVNQFLSILDRRSAKKL